MDYSQIFQIIDKYDLNFLPIIYQDKKPCLSSWNQYQIEKVPKQEFKEKYFQIHSNTGIAILGGLVSNNLYIIDIDQMEFANEFEKIIPSTLTVKTRNGKHFYYFNSTTLESSKYKFFQNDIEIFGIDIQANKKYCVAPPSIHPTGIQYEFSNFTDIKTIEFSEIIKKIYFLGKKMNYTIIFSKNKPKKQNKIINPNTKSNLTDLENALPSLSSMIGFDGMGLQPIHGSKHGDKGKNMSVDSLNNRWYCFHCENGGYKIQWFAIEYFHLINCNDINILTKEQWKELFEEIRKQYNLSKITNTNFLAKEQYKLQKMQRHAI